jgi:hypothetical protein
MCFIHLIELYASHHYYTTQAIWYQPIYTSTSMFWMTWLIFIFQKKGKKLKYLKPTCYLTKIKQFEDGIIQKKMVNNGQICK